MGERKRAILLSGIIFVVFMAALTVIFHTYVSDPVFSVESGFYLQDFELEIGCLNPELTIYYTTDGTVPNQDSIQYTGPVRIYDYSVNENVYSARADIAFEEGQYGYVWTPKEKVRKGMVINAIAYNKYGQSSNIVTKTYFVSGGGQEAYGELPVLSITTDPDNLFGYNEGIYVYGKAYDDWLDKNKEKLDAIDDVVWGYPSNFQKKGKEWEREAQIEIMENGRKVLTQKVGIRVRGGSTRFFEQKSFSIYARKKYGNEKIRYNIFPESRSELNGDLIEQYDSFIIRNWGNNWRTFMLIDPLVQTLVKDRNISTQCSQPCVLFLNGEYWGLYDMKEKYGKEYFRQHYGIEKDNLIMVKAQATEDKSGRAVEIGNGNDIVEFEELEQFIENNDLSKKKSYDLICEMVDIDSFIDLYAIRMYVEAVDFPANNEAWWKTRVVSDKPFQDGKWRGLLYDVDPDLRYPNYYNGLELSKSGSAMFSKLLKNEEFKQRFVMTVCDLSNKNFDYENVKEQLTILKDACLPYICEYYDRFGPRDIGDQDTDKITYFISYYDKMLNFFKNQKTYIQQLLKKEGLVGGDINTLKIVLNKKDGSVMVNSIQPEFEDLMWEGEYFSDFPVRLAVMPDEGRQFQGWFDEEGNFLSDTLELDVQLEKSKTIKAEFK